MKEYGYTSKQWKEDVSKRDKILMYAKRNIDIEKTNREKEKIKKGRDK